MVSQHTLPSHPIPTKMSSLAASSSFVFPAAPALSHSLNSRGELGMFVNPYGCSCQTCVDYVGEAPATPLRVRADTPPPAPVKALAPLPSWPYPVTLARSSAVSSDYEPQPLDQADLFLRRLDAAAEYEHVSAPAPAPAPVAAAAVAEQDFLVLPACSAAESTVLRSAHSLRLSYQARQDLIYSEEHRSHDEMAAADAEWEDLDSKISAIDSVLRAFGAVVLEP